MNVESSEDELPNQIQTVRPRQVKSVFELWTERTPRLHKVLWETMPVDSIEWQNCLDISYADSLIGQKSYCEDRINSRLARGYVKTFKVGITFSPLARWTHSKHGYQTLGYAEMNILAVHNDCDFIKSLEVEVLKTYRKFDIKGRLVNKHGHFLCGNRRPGGESGDHGFGPHFLYLAVKLNVPGK